MSTQNNAAKFAFFYLLSLVALIFMALSSGMVIFQVINKFITDVINAGRYSDEALKFAISAIIVSTPIYYITMRQIHKNLLSGGLNEESGIRKWLTYLILLIASVVMIGWFIATVNSFFNGELTTKFILKSITAIGIAAVIFGFYFYDIKRENIVGKKDNVIRIYFYASLAAVIAVFITALFVVESPTETRNRRQDEAVLSNFSQIDNAINSYYAEKNSLPENTGVLVEEYTFITEETIKNPATDEMFGYNIKATTTYELCTTFLTSNKEKDDRDFVFDNNLWPHDEGYQCLEQKIRDNRIDGIKPVIR